MTGKQLKNSILQWAIQGKLVPQDPNDEPASVLLERIRAEKARLVKEKKIKKDKNESVIFRGEDNSYYEKILATGEIRCIDDEVPFDIPDTWQWARLGSIISVGGGKRIPAGRKLTKEVTPQIYIRVSDMKNGEISDKDLHYVPNDIIPLISRYTISRDDVYITVAGTIGKIGIVPLKFDGANLTENADKLIIPEYNKFFLVLTLESPFVQQQISDVTTKVGQPKLAIARIENLLIPVVPKDEQQRIVNHFNKVKSLISTYDTSIIKLQEVNDSIRNDLRKSIIQEAIQGRLVPQIESEGTAEELLVEVRAEKERLVKEGKLKKSVLAYESYISRGEDNRYYEQIGNSMVDISNELPFEIPANWRWSRLGNIANLHIGKTPPRGEPKYWLDGKWPWVSISDIKDGAILTETKERVSDEAAKQVFKCNISPKGSLLMSFKLTIGKVAILGIDAFHNEAIITIRPCHENDALLQYLKRVLPIISQIGEAKDAIKGKTLSSTSLTNLFVPLPPINEQVRIEARLSELFQKLK